MSDLAYQRFMASYMLTEEEIRNKLEVIDATEDALHARGYECDERIKEISEEQLKDVLKDARRIREKKKSRKRQQQEQQQDKYTTEEEQEQEEEIVATNSI